MIAVIQRCSSSSVRIDNKKISEISYGLAVLLGICIDDKEKDAFIHASAVKAAGLRFLNEGDSLEFELSEDSGKGPSAINIKKTD